MLIVNSHFVNQNSMLSRVTLWTSVCCFTCLHKYVYTFIQVTGLYRFIQVYTGLYTFIHVYKNFHFYSNVNIRFPYFSGSIEIILWSKTVDPFYFRFNLNTTDLKTSQK